MMIFDVNNICLNIEVSSKSDALKKIAKIAKKIDIVDDEKGLYDSFINREKESSTGFEDGFAIPHARSSVIKRTSFLYVTFKNGIDWDSIDKKPTKYLFVLLVPKQEEENDHVEILSKISTWLMDTTFVSKLITLKTNDSVFNLITKRLNDRKETEEKIIVKNDSLNILALTACPVGVAHTYLAAEKIKEGAKKLNINIKVETHGSAGIKNNLTDEEIQNADFIIIASDIGLDLTRFNNKRVFETSVKKAIHNPVELIEEAKINAKILSTNSKNIQQSGSAFSKSEKKSYVMKHILAGISYMIPFIILGGICIALAVGLGKIIYGDNFGAPRGDFLYYIEQIGAVAFTLMIGVLGGYIANSIGGRAAIAPAFIVSVLGNTPNALFSIGGINVVTAMGFIGSILFGLAIGYTVKWINSWRINKSLTAIMPIFVIPLGVGLFYSLITIFIVGAPIGYVMDLFIGALEQAFKSQTNGLSIGLGIGFGILIGAMAGFDMGGPINKVAFLTCSALISAKIYEPMGMMAAAIPIAPLGMGFCTIFFRKKFTEQEKTMGISSVVMGLIGISEGAIPFAVSDPKRAITSNVIGSAVAGAIAGAAGVTNVAAHGGPIVGVLGAVGSNQGYGIAGGIGFFFLAIIIGTIVTTLIYGFWKRPIDKNNEVDLTPNKKYKFNKLFSISNFKIKKSNNTNSDKILLINNIDKLSIWNKTKRGILC